MGDWPGWIVPDHFGSEIVWQEKYRVGENVLEQIYRILVSFL